MIILFYTACEETKVEHERPMALCCETGGYESRAGMSFGDKAIIMLNLCRALKAVPCERALTYLVHIECARMRRRSQRAEFIFQGSSIISGCKLTVKPSNKQRRLETCF